MALAGLALGLAAAWQLHDQLVVLRAVLLGSVVPYTLIVILPTNKRLLDPALEAKLDRAAELLARWNQLHAVRTALSGVAFVLLLRRVAADASR